MSRADYGTFVDQSSPRFRDIFHKKPSADELITTTTTTTNPREVKRTVALLNHHDNCIILHFDLYYKRDQFFQQLLRHVAHMQQEIKRKSYESALLHLKSIGQLARVMVSIVDKAQIFSKQSTIYQILSEYSNELGSIDKILSVDDEAQRSLVIESYLKPLLENVVWLKVASQLNLTSAPNTYDVPCQLPEQYMRDVLASRMTEEGVAMRAIQSNVFVDRTEQVQRELLCKYAGAFLTLMSNYRHFQQHVRVLDPSSPLVLELEIEILGDLLEATERIFYKDSPLVKLLRDFYLTGSPDFQWLHRPHYHSTTTASDHEPHSTFFELAHLIRKRIDLNEKMLEWQLALERRDLETSIEEFFDEDEVSLRQLEKRETEIFVENSRNFNTLFELERDYVNRIFFDIITRFTVTEALCDESDSDGVAIDVTLRKVIKEKARDRERRLLHRERSRKSLFLKVSNNDDDDKATIGGAVEKTASDGGSQDDQQRIVYLANYLASPVTHRTKIVHADDNDNDVDNNRHYVRSSLVKY